MTQLYDTDFYIWTQEMAPRLRERDVAALDWENIAEEIESMGKRDYRSLESDPFAQMALSGREAVTRGEKYHRHATRPH